MAPPSAPGSPARSLRVRAAINQIACALIAFVLWQLSVDASFVQSLVFSLLIGNTCWLLIELGRAGVARWRHARRGGSREWPGWPWMAGIVAVGTVAGYLIGNTLARALLGLPTSRGGLHPPVLAFSLVVAMTVSYLFYARERLHQQHLQALAAERLVSETQLQLLQSQLEPHMLFNTLANLRVLIGLDPAQAQAMLDHLVAFLRSTLASTRRERHALADEFEALRDYLALMAVRMGPRLQTGFDLPDALRDVPLPPLLLQPLVENAIRHGLEPQVDGGAIEVGARRAGDSLLLWVRDTGAGLGSSGAGGTSFGLDLVRQRLARAYGDAARFELRPAADGRGGAEALITLPLSPSLPPPPATATPTP